MYSLPVDVDVQMIQKNKLFQKFVQQQEQIQKQQPQVINKPRQDSIDNHQKYSHDKMEESSIYQDFANFAKATNYKQASPYSNSKQQQIQMQQLPNQSSNSEIKELQFKNKTLLQQNSILQQQLIEIQQTVHRYTIDLDITKNEVLNQRRVIQEQQIEIEQLKRQIQEKRNSSLDKTRQFTIVQTQLIQSNQMVEKLISQLMNQEQQLSLYRQTQMTFPKIDGFNIEQNKSNLLNAQNLLQNNSGQIPTQIPNYPPMNNMQQQMNNMPQQMNQPQVPQPNPVSQPTKQQQDVDTSYERYLQHKRGRF